MESVVYTLGGMIYYSFAGFIIDHTIIGAHNCYYLFLIAFSLFNTFLNRINIQHISNE